MTTVYRVEIRGERLGDYFSLQTHVTANDPATALQTALRRWGITEEMLTKIHVQEYE